MDRMQASREDPRAALHTITPTESGNDAAIDFSALTYINPTSEAQWTSCTNNKTQSTTKCFNQESDRHCKSTLQIPEQSARPYFRPSEFEVAAIEAMSRHSQVQGGKESPQYQLMSSETPAEQARTMSQNNKDQLINSLRTHRVNTITELRRIEKIFAYLDSAEVTEPMTSAWAHYVNSNNLLNELRGLTKTIPFSSECMDEAKALVVNDPASVRSWNFCWLVLVKIEKENLVLKYAKALASKRSTWGDRQPTADDARKFITACLSEWTNALRQLLKHWESPPSTTGN